MTGCLNVDILPIGVLIFDSRRSVGAFGLSFAGSEFVVSHLEV